MLTKETCVSAHAGFPLRMRSSMLPMDEMELSSTIRKVVNCAVYAASRTIHTCRAIAGVN